MIRSKNKSKKIVVKTNCDIVEQSNFIKNKEENTKKNIEFNNNYIKYMIEENKKNKIKKIINELKTIYPLNDNLLIDIYNKSISLHQTNIHENGYFLENNIVATELFSKNIPFKQQVTINKNGIIVGFNQKKKKCFHIIDFVIGNDISIGKSITNYKIISCKTTCRERWTQDNWTLTFIPIKYILLTLSNDYPSTIRFGENEKRKIITCNPKILDDRKYKLNFENMINEII